MTSLFPHLEGVSPDSRFGTLAEQAAAAEAWETPRWAARAILEAELLTSVVVDPCCGTGVLSEAAKAAGYDVLPLDLYEWGYEGPLLDWFSDLAADYVTTYATGRPFSVLMNPPFSRATGFVDRAFTLGARKVVCFQRQAWRESRDRRQWWEAHPPARTWVCGDRAVPYLLHLSPEERKAMNGMQTAHAWYVWERHHKGAEIGGAIWKDMGR
jgi:predicted RNA methylase